MPTLDVTTLLNWIMSGSIGLVFGVISAWATHRFQMRRDNLAWQREKEKMQERFEQEKSLINFQFEQKFLELEKQVAQQQSSQIKSEILRGVENPGESIRHSQKFHEMLVRIEHGEYSKMQEMPVSIGAEMLKMLVEKESYNDLAFLEEITEKKKALDAGDITEQEFKEVLHNFLKRKFGEDQNTG